MLTAFKKFVDSWKAAAAAAGTVKAFASFDKSFVFKCLGSVLNISISMIDTTLWR